IVEGLMKYVQGEPVDFSEEQSEKQVNPALLIENEEFGYCTEFIVRLSDDYLKKFDEKILKQKLTDMGGESLVVVRDEDLVKVHVHTLKPGDALNIGQRYGEFLKLKIENMQEQHSTIIANAEEPKTETKVTEKKKAEQKNGIITVAAGEGVTKLFYDLGTDVVIEGGQTMNPSTEDFVKVIEELDNCTNVFIFPNNSNIILAAKQAQSVLADRNIYVVETKSIQAGLSAIGVFNKEGDPDDIIEELNEVIANVEDISVTYAIKDTTFEGVEVREGDYMAIGGKQIMESGKDRKGVVLRLLDRLFKNDEKSILTIITGEGVDEKESHEIEEYVSDNSDFDLVMIKGDQPVYSYLIGLE
ncbi:MAG: hypothetical protein J5796_00130, partial [Erysipelotrichaceae bacterium]|nr:hypothetical protein [Erysipelotrichaceae bacterium]